MGSMGFNGIHGSWRRAGAAMMPTRHRCVHGGGWTLSGSLCTRISPDAGHGRVFHRSSATNTAMPMDRPTTAASIIIVGGGIAGLALAASLATTCAEALKKLGPIIVLDRGRHPPQGLTSLADTSRHAGIYHHRVTMLSPASVKLLKDVGAYDGIQSLGRTCSVEHMKIWDAESGGKMTFAGKETAADGAYASSASPISLLGMVQDVMTKGLMQATLPEHLVSSIRHDRRHKNDQAAPSDPLPDEATSLGVIAENEVIQGALYDVLRQDAYAGLVQCLHGTTIKDLTIDGQAAIVTCTPTEASPTEHGVSTEPVACAAKTTTFIAPLVIGADGHGSWVRQTMGFETVGGSYEHRGIVATLEMASHGTLPRADHSGEVTENASDGDAGMTPLLRDTIECIGTEKRDYPTTAYQRFLPTGTLALLPLNDRYMSLVWSLPAQYAQKIRRLSSEEQAMLINVALRLSPDDLAYILEQVVPDMGATGDASLVTTMLAELTWRMDVARRNADVAERMSMPSHKLPWFQAAHQAASFPLRWQHATTYVQHRVALIGDAAHTVHPLAGQGLNLALRDVTHLTRHLHHALHHTGSDPGDVHVLKGYGRHALPQNLAFLAAIHALHHWGCGTGEAAGPVRAAVTRRALAAMDDMPMLKAWLARTAGSSTMKLF